MGRPRRNSAARTRELGGELRRSRAAAELTAIELARKLGCSESKVTRMETGERGASEFDVIAFLAHCGVPRRQIEPILELARESDDGFRLRPHGDQIPDELRSLIYQETTARRITAYEPEQVPGILQTEDYARETFALTGLTPADKVEHNVAIRLARQHLLHRHAPPEFTFFVHENAIRSDIYPRQVMHEQVLHLVFMSDRPQCALRIVPADALPGGLFGGTFWFLRYQDHDPVVYVQNLMVSLFLEDAAAVAAHRRALRTVADVALDQEESRAWLARLASRYDRPEDAPR